MAVFIVKDFNNEIITVCKPSVRYVVNTLIAYGDLDETTEVRTHSTEMPYLEIMEVLGEDWAEKISQMDVDDFNYLFDWHFNIECWEIEG